MPCGYKCQDKTQKWATGVQKVDPGGHKAEVTLA